LSKSEVEDEQIRVRIEGVEAEISSQREAVMAMERKREIIEYRLLFYFIAVGAKEIGPFFRTWEMIARAMMKESMLVMQRI
jgi:hypothetical protein